jgi:hypothetical protein
MPCFLTRKQSEAASSRRAVVHENRTQMALHTRASAVSVKHRSTTYECLRMILAIGKVPVDAINVPAVQSLSKACWTLQCSQGFQSRWGSPIWITAFAVAAYGTHHSRLRTGHNQADATMERARRVRLLSTAGSFHDIISHGAKKLPNVHGSAQGPQPGHQRTREEPVASCCRRRLSTVVPRVSRKHRHVLDSRLACIHQRHCRSAPDQDSRR